MVNPIKSRAVLRAKMWIISELPTDHDPNSPVGPALMMM